MSVGMGDRADRIIRDGVSRYVTFLLELDPHQTVPRISREEWERAVKGQRGDAVRRD